MERLPMGAEVRQISIRPIIRLNPLLRQPIKGQSMQPWWHKGRTPPPPEWALGHYSLITPPGLISTPSMSFNGSNCWQRVGQEMRSFLGAHSPGVWLVMWSSVGGDWTTESIPMCYKWYLCVWAEYQDGSQLQFGKHRHGSEGDMGVAMLWWKMGVVK